MKTNGLIFKLSVSTVCAILVVGIAFHFLIVSDGSPDWRLAGNHAPRGLLTQFVKDNAINLDKFDADEMTVREVNLPRQTQPLYFIDPRISKENIQKEPLCGMAGCLFTGYVKTGRKDFQSVFEFYLNPWIPPEFDLFWTELELRNGMPLLHIIQKSPRKGIGLVRATLVFDGNQYVVATMD
ncbi:MAG: hypothetical protein AAF716_03815 [Cyanobacteria bacterium P01_D01_bin.1]